MSFNSQIKDAFSTFRPSAQFMHLYGYINAHNEKSNYKLLFGVDYEDCVRRSLEAIKKVDINEIELKGFTKEDLAQAGIELLLSFNETLKLGPGNNSQYTNQGVYDQVLGSSGNPIKGLMLHKENEELHMNGVYRMEKTVIVPGVYPEKNKRPKTLAKDTLRALTPLSKWGQFKLTPGNFERIVADKKEFSF